MDLPKEFLRQFVFTVAVNSGQMNDQLADEIKEYKFETFAKLLAFRARELENKAMNGDQFFDSSYYLESVKTIQHVLDNLESILELQHEAKT
jgi:hypothetical protein